MKEAQLKHNELEKKPYDTAAISVWIDSYDDIFSDFDPRPFAERTISDDFIVQLKKVLRETKGKIPVLRILVPQEERKDEYEKIIRKRLQYYFGAVHDQLMAETKAIKVKGIYFSFWGIVLMVIASYISFLKMSNFYINLILVLFEPAGWFLLWSGLDHLIYFSKTKRNETDFYTRISNTRVEFGAYTSRESS